MKDFTIKEAADEAALNFPGVSPEAVRYICEYALGCITEVVKNKTHRIRLQKCDIHTIYYDIRPDEQRALLADLDETRVLTEKEEDLHIIDRMRNAQALLPGVIKRLNRRYKRAHHARYTADNIYPE